MESEITIKDRCRQIEEIASTQFGEQYADASGQIVDAEALVIDVLANLWHLCDSRVLDFGKLDRTAYDYYLIEKADERAKRRPQEAEQTVQEHLFKREGLGDCSSPSFFSTGEEPMEIYCGLCGQKEHQLFSHLREVHEMSPDRYRERCQGTPLISEDLATYIRDARIMATERGIKKHVELFGIGFLIDILPGQPVPQVDEGYVFQEELSQQILVSLKEGEKILLVGPTGCGKSTLVEQLAARLNWPVVRVAASGGLTESDLLGEWTVRDGETIFNYGFLPRAMRMGAVCLIDEIDGMEPSVAFAIHQLMEDQGKLVLLQNGGEIIEPHESFRLITTANTLGNGDESGLYTGTRVLNAAFLDRFAAVFRMSYMAPDLEVEIIRSRVPDCTKTLAKKLVKVASDVREARQNDQLYCTFSTRRLIEVARKHSQVGGLQAALEVAALSRLQDEDRRVVFEICQRHLGDMLGGKEVESNES